MKLDSDLIKSARQLIDASNSIVITNHINPDGDAMGSALGLAEVLKKEGKKVQVIVPNQYPNFLKWMDNGNKTLIYEDEKDKADELIKEADLIFHLDYNSLKRSGPMEAVLGEVTAKRIMIDHHQEPGDFCDVCYSDTSMSSTCEMVYHFTNNLGWENLLDARIAANLYAGITTDTGSFKYSSTSPETLRVAAALIEKGVKPQDIASLVYDTNTPSKLKLLSRALERMDLLTDSKTAVISLTEDDLIKYNYQRGDTEGIVNYGLSVLGIVFSAFFYPRDGLIKMSFRSKGDFDVNAFARKHFNGGGHKNAAGGACKESLEETLKKFHEILPSYREELNNV